MIALGLKFGQCEAGDADGKAKANDVTVKFLETFRNKNGFYMCRELLGCDLAANDGKLYAKEHNLFAEICPEMVAPATETSKKLLNKSTDNLELIIMALFNNERTLRHRYGTGAVLKTDILYGLRRWLSLYRQKI